MVKLCREYLGHVLVVLSISTVLQVSATLDAAERQTWHLELRNIGGGPDYAYPYSPVCFSPDSKLLAISVANHISSREKAANEEESPVCKDIPTESGIAIWRVDSLEFLKWIPTVSRKVIQFSPDGKSITALDDSQMFYWDIHTGEESATTLIEDANFANHLRCGFVILPDERIVAITNKGLSLFSSSGKLEAKLLPDSHHDILQIQLSPDNQKVIADSWYWNLKSDERKVAKKMCLVESVFRPGTEELWGHDRNANNPVLMWPYKSNKLVNPIKEGLNLRHGATNGMPQFRIESVAFDPSGKLLATVGYDSCVHLWNAETGKRIVTIEVTRASRKHRRMLDGSTPTLKYVKFSSDGKWLLAGAVESVSIFRMADLLPNITPDGVFQLRQFFSGSKLVEEVVNN